MATPVGGNSADATFNAAGDAVTTAVDVGAGNRRYLAVRVQWATSGAHTLSDTALTRGAQTLSPMGAAVSVGSQRIRDYELVNPEPGSVNLSVDPSTGGGDATATISWMAFDDVDQTTPSDNYGTENGTDTTAERTQPSAIGDTPIVFVSVRGFSPTAIAPTNYTEGFVENVNGSFMTGGGYGTGAASVAFVGTISAGGINEWITGGWNLNTDTGAAAVILDLPSSMDADFEFGQALEVITEGLSEINLPVSMDMDGEFGSGLQVLLASQLGQTVGRLASLNRIDSITEIV